MILENSIFTEDETEGCELNYKPDFKYRFYQGAFRCLRAMFPEKRVKTKGYARLMRFGALGYWAGEEGIYDDVCENDFYSLADEVRFYYTFEAGDWSFFQKLIFVGVTLFFDRVYSYSSHGMFFYGFSKEKAIKRFDERYRCYDK